MRVSRKISTHTVFIIIIIFCIYEASRKKHAPHPPLKQAKHTKIHTKRNTDRKEKKHKLGGEKVTNIYLIIYFYIKINVYLKQNNKQSKLNFDEARKRQEERERIAKYEM